MMIENYPGPLEAGSEIIERFNRECVCVEVDTTIFVDNFKTHPVGPCSGTRILLLSDPGAIHKTVIFIGRELHNNVWRAQIAVQTLHQCFCVRHGGVQHHGPGWVDASSSKDVPRVLGWQICTKPNEVDVLLHLL